MGEILRFIHSAMGPGLPHLDRREDFSYNQAEETWPETGRAGFEKKGACT